jgi:MYXO-CTERM domain-containing protein
VLHLDAAPEGFDIPSICDAGSYCEEIAQNTCTSQSTNQACSTDSDCPSTWTCGCEALCSGALSPPPGEDASPAAPSCTLVCLAPNSDLMQEVCAGPASFSGNGGSAAAAPSPSGSSDAGGATSAGDTATGTASGAHGGGCQVGAGDPSAIAGLITAAALALARRRPRKRT